MSAYASHALSVLINPIERSVYLLKVMTGERALCERDNEVPQDLIIEVFAIREEIEECETEDQLMQVQIDIQTRFEDIMEEVNNRFEDKEYSGINDLLKKARYWERILEHVDNKMDRL